METSSNNDVGGGEDIRSKLARYKKEREDFELVRQKFRQKNAELSINNATQQHSGSENTPVQHVSGNYGTALGKQYSSAGADGSKNIFASMGVEQSAGSSQIQAFTAANVTGGSPAFGQPEQNASNANVSVGGHISREIV